MPDQVSKYERYKETKKAASKRWAQANPDKIAVYQQRWREKNPDANKAYHIQHRYGITLDEAKELAKHQGGCAICGETKRLDVDHNHANGQVRGLLCRGCNIAVAQLEKSPEFLAKVVNYIDKWREVARSG